MNDSAAVVAALGDERPLSGLDFELATSGHGWSVPGHHRTGRIERNFEATQRGPNSAARSSAKGWNASGSRPLQTASSAACANTSTRAKKTADCTAGTDGWGVGVRAGHESAPSRSGAMLL
jgi:hypothetical protein